MLAPGPFLFASGAGDQVSRRSSRRLRCGRSGRLRPDALGHQFLDRSGRLRLLLKAECPRSRGRLSARRCRRSTSGMRRFCRLISRRPLQEKGVRVVQVETGGDHELDECALSRRDCPLAAEVLHELLAPVQEGASGRRPPVDRGQSAFHRPAEPVVVTAPGTFSGMPTEGAESAAADRTAVAAHAGSVCYHLATRPSGITQHHAAHRRS
jgi:hypothetical protein